MSEDKDRYCAFEFERPELNFTLQLHSQDELVSKTMSALGEWEPVETAIVSEILQPDDLFIDVGANIGYYSVLGSRLVGPDGVVIALEPENTNFQLFKKNIILNQVTNVTVHNSAAGDRDKTVKLYHSDENSGDHHTYRRSDSDTGIAVKAVRLDTLVASTAIRPRLIKIDCQGYEQHIIDGLKAVLENPALKPDAIILEFWPEMLNKAGADVIQFANYLFALNYTIWDIGRGHEKPKPLDLIAFTRQIEKRLLPDKEIFTNLLLFDQKMTNQLEKWKNEYEFVSVLEILKIFSKHQEIQSS